MQQFDLSVWLQDKSRKVVTRDGRPVRIVCWDAKMECPIMALALNKSSNKEIALHYRVDGTYSALMESDVDLFFADEKEELAEFEKYVRNILGRYISNIDDFPETIKNEAKLLLELARKELSNDNFKIKDTKEYNSLTDFEKAMCDVCSISGGYQHAIISTVKQFSKTILNLAKNELEKPNVIIDKDKYLRNCDYYYNKGKQDALKDLPRWKKANVFVSDEFGLATRDDDLIITNAGYQIKLSDLKTLPKEE